MARNASTHAAGVVISREPLTELMPLQRATNSDAVMTQYEMHAVDALGLLKFDFLGLSNLTILRQAVDLIREHRGEEIDLEKIPLDDAKTFELLASGETTGVFQLESAGMRRYIRELRPSTVFDLAAMVALYRPGPMDNIPAYIRRKHGEEKVTYLHPLLEPYLNRTYGVFVYQEDIMSASTALAGFTGPEADMLGYAIRKKKAALMREMREKFVRQAAERGVKPQVIDAVFAAFQPFERYGFNKAHATCYGLIAYQTAYLKANYTVDYMTSVLTAFRDNEEKVAAAVAECRRLGIEVRPPDVHRSFVEFTVEDDAIRFGLLAVKNVGEGAIESIIAAREEGGEFRSLADFCSRVDLRLVNKRVMESLVKVGAMSRFGHAGAAAGGARRRHGRRPGGPARPNERPDVAVRHGVVAGGAGAAAAAGAGGALARAAALGEGAARALPVGASAGRDGRPDRPVRDGLLGRPEGRVARRPAGRDGRHRHGRADRHDPQQGDDGRRHAGGPAGDAGGRGLPAGCTPRAAAPSPRARSCWWPGGWTIAARRRRCWPTRSGSGRTPRPAAPRRSPRKWPPASAGGGAAAWGGGAARAAATAAEGAATATATAAAAAAAAVRQDRLGRRPGPRTRPRRDPGTRPWPRRLRCPSMRVSPLRGGGVSAPSRRRRLQPRPRPGDAAPGRPPGGRARHGPAAVPRPPPAPSEPLASVPAPDDLAALAPEREEPPLPDEARAVAARASAAPTAPSKRPPPAF